MTAPVFDFNGDVAVVTGRAAGIGFGIAQAFRAAGTRVAIGHIREPPLKKAAGHLGRDGVFAHTVDVRDERSVKAFLGAAERALGPVTIAIANAGIYPNTPVLDMPVEEWDRVMETNARGVFLTCRAAVRSMAARGAPGKVVTIASGAAFSDAWAARTTAPRRPPSSCSLRCSRWKSRNRGSTSTAWRPGTSRSMARHRY